jgi:hypothetical protein
MGTPRGCTFSAPLRTALCPGLHALTCSRRGRIAGRSALLFAQKSTLKEAVSAPRKGTTFQPGLRVTPLKAVSQPHRLETRSWIGLARFIAASRNRRLPSGRKPPTSTTVARKAPYRYVRIDAIAWLCWFGDDAVEAKALLRKFEIALAEHLFDRERLRMQLALLDGTEARPMPSHAQTRSASG